MDIKCSVHPDREAAGACCNCNKYVCSECKAAIGGQIYCNACVGEKLRTGSWPGQTSLTLPFASGMGANSPIPPEIQGWNWGGFLLTWIWGVGNNVWISLISLFGLVPYIGWIVSLAMMIILGLRGNEWAWQNKKWDSIEHFKNTQKRWMWWGVGVLAAQIILAIAVSVLVVSLIMIAKTVGFDWNELIPKDW
jgi:hypothetical protein